MAHEKDLVRVNVMLSRDDLATLDIMAQARGVSRSALLRDIISQATRMEHLKAAVRPSVLTPAARRMTFEEALQVARDAAKRLKGFDGVGEIRKWRDRR
ncbi:MAG: CopG family transcriptional regulator [Bacillota bacterium]